ncbi:MAG: hypothetical protein ACREQ5_00705 [Candidatus Dormibacteria bacterium]
MSGSSLERLGAVSREYAEKANSFEAVAVAAAHAEAEHKAERAKAILRYRAVEGCRSHAEAETRAEADDRIADLYHTRLITAAVADAHREKLRQLREQISYGRTHVASEREADRIHAAGYEGAP